MAVIIDPLLLVIFSGVMFFCSGFASYGCYRCYTDMDGSKVVPEGNELGFLKKSKERYRLRFLRRRPSTSSTDATIYSVHSSEIWSRRSTPTLLRAFTPSPSPSARSIRRGSPSSFINTEQIRKWTIKEEPEPEETNEIRRFSAPA